MILFRTLTSKSFLIIMLYCLMVYCVYGGKVVWQKEFKAGGELSYSPGAVTFDNIDKKLFVIGTSFLPKIYSEGKFMLWEIDLNGTMTKEEYLGEIPEKYKIESHTASRLIKGLSLSNNDRIKARGFFEELGKSVMNMNRQGNDRIIKSVDEMSIAYDNDLILKTIDLPNGDCLFIGRNQGDDGLAIKIDSYENKVWGQTYDKGQLEYLSDAVAIGNKGEFVIVGGSLKPEGLMSIENGASIWILKCDSQGSIISDRIFSGDPLVRKMPQICLLSTGEIIVAYNQSQSNSLAFKAFSPNLEELWDKKANIDENNVYDFKIKAVPGKGFVVAVGFGSTGLGLYEFNKDGEKISTYLWEKIVRGGNFLLETSMDMAFVILQTRAHDENRINNLKVIALQLD